MGDKIVEKEIPENLLADAKKYRAEMFEKVVEHDDATMSKYLEGKEDVLNTLVDYFNQLDESKGFESKKEILDKVLTLLPSE